MPTWKLSVMNPRMESTTPRSAPAASFAWEKPITRYATSATTRDGPVVKIMCLMWSNRLEPATAGARFVVSDRGDILSPKYAPDTTAPAVIAGLKPKAVPTPIRATPMEPAVDQEEPVARDTMEQSRQAVNRKMDGAMILIP